jgi:HEAT repeat protein
VTQSPDEDLITALTRLRRHAEAGRDEILPVLKALRDLCFAAPVGQRRQIPVGRGTLGDAVPVLREFLRDADMEVAEWACQVLGHMGARECLPDLLDLLRPEARKERGLTGTFPFDDWGLSYPDESAMYALRFMEATEAVPDIVRCLASDNKRTRHTAGTTLQDMNAAPQVTLVLAHRDDRLRQAAQEFLSSTSIKASLLPAVEAALLALLRDGVADVRRSVVQVLGRTASIAAVLPLLESLEWGGTDEQLETTTRAAIAEIQSRQPGAAPGQVSVTDATTGQVSVAEDESGRMALDEPPGTGRK